LPEGISGLGKLACLGLLGCGLSSEVVAEVKRLVPQGCEVHVYV